MKKNRIQSIISDLLYDYFERLEKSKKVEKGWKGDQKVLLKSDEESLTNKLKIYFKESVYISTVLDDFSEDSQCCNLKNTDVFEFSTTFNSETKRVKFHFEFDNGISYCDKEKFQSDFINENCDCEILIKQFILTIFMLSNTHVITIKVIQSEILSLGLSKENWFNSKLFGKQINSSNSFEKNSQLKQNKGCFGLLSFIF
jgi:hypothetical protein